MESMGIIGFVFGLAGLSFALQAKEKVAEMSKELENFKQELRDSGAIK